MMLLGMKEEEFSTWEQLESASLRAESILEIQDRGSHFRRNSAMNFNDGLQHADEDAVEASAVNMFRQRNTICYNCHQKGHQHKDCNRPRKVFCFKCGREGVLSSQCACNQPSSSNSFTAEQISDIVSKIIESLKQVIATFEKLTSPLGQSGVMSGEEEKQKFLSLQVQDDIKITSIQRKNSSDPRMYVTALIDNNRLWI